MQHKLNILHVEDSDDDSLLIRRELSDAGFEICYKLVDNAESLQSALSEAQWDVVISDFTMPSFSGIEALYIIKDFNKNLPVVFVSSTMDTQLVEEVESVGANGYVSKSNLCKLKDAILKVLK